jgi:hypothetical protein
MTDLPIHPPDSLPGHEMPTAPRGRFRRAVYHLSLVLTLRCEAADLIRLRARHGETTWTEDLAELLHRRICGTCRRSKHQAEVVDTTLRAFAERETR